MMRPNALAGLDDLLGKNRIITDPELLRVYGQDWSQMVEPKPMALVFPTNTDEVSRILKYCSENGLAVVPSGGRTGLSGGACAPNGELILSLEKMNRMEKVDIVSLTLHVQAGAITQAVHEACAPFGLTWPVDFASKGSSQVGGNLATNAGGVRVIRYGNTRNWVLGITAVTMDGTILELNGALEKNNTGLDFRNLLIGSEGVLAIITEATLKLARIPEETSVAFFAVSDFSAVVKLFAKARSAPFALSAYEVLDEKCFARVIKNLHIKAPFTSAAGAYVLMEHEIRKGSEQEALEAWQATLFEDGLVQDGVLAMNPREKSDLWKIREGVAESIMMDGLVYQQDVSVPVAQLEEFYAGIRNRYDGAYPEFTTHMFGHIGDGNIHIFILKPSEMDPKEFKMKCEDSNKALFEYVQENGGSVSAEHGIGLLKKNAIGYSRSEKEIFLMKEIKRVFDPKGLLNPGKMIS